MVPVARWRTRDEPATRIHRSPPSATGRHPASLMWRSDEPIPTAAMATVVPMYATSLMTGPQDAGTTPTERAAAATRNSTRNVGISFHHTGRVPASELRWVRHDSYRASGMIASVRVSLTTTATVAAVAPYTVAAATTDEVSLMAVPAHRPNDSCDSPIACPMRGKKIAPITL